MPLLVACESMVAAVWAECGISCNLGYPIDLVHAFKNPISLARCAMFAANLPSYWGVLGFSWGETSTLDMLGVKYSCFILGPPPRFQRFSCRRWVGPLLNGKGGFSLAACIYHACAGP